MPSSPASMNHARPRRRGPSPAIALLLTAVWPGAGHAFIGLRRPGGVVMAVFAVLVLPVALLALGGVRDMAALLVPRNALVLTLVAAAVTVIWIAALADIYRRVRPPRPFGFGRATAALVAVVALVGTFATVSAWSLYGATTRVFQPSFGAIATPGVGQPRPSVGEGMLPTPRPSEIPADGRINILLVGADSGLGYEHALTDTLMVVSVDPVARSVNMISVPRDIARFPMPDGGTYDKKINSLVTVADENPTTYPDGGLATLRRAVAHLIGVPIPYVAYINLSGFRDLVDAVGGVEVDVQTALNDRGYQFPDGKVGFRLAAGPQLLDGRVALAFVRSRNSPGENDFTRARRQQQFLVALRDKLTSPAMLPRLPDVLDAVAGLVSTNFPPERVGELVELADDIPRERITGVVLGPPYAKRPSSGGEYILVPDLDKMAEWSTKVFGDASRYATD